MEEEQQVCSVADWQEQTGARLDSSEHGQAPVPRRASSEDAEQIHTAWASFEVGIASLMVDVASDRLPYQDGAEAYRMGHPSGTSYKADKAYPGRPVTFQDAYQRVGVIDPEVHPSQDGRTALPVAPPDYFLGGEVDYSYEKKFRENGNSRGKMSKEEDTFHDFTEETSDAFEIRRKRK